MAFTRAQTLSLSVYIGSYANLANLAETFTKLPQMVLKDISPSEIKFISFLLKGPAT